MAIGYLADEALGYVIDCTSLSPYIKKQMWDMEEDEKNYGKYLDGGTRKMKLSDREREHSQLRDLELSTISRAAKVRVF